MLVGFELLRSRMRLFHELKTSLAPNIDKRRDEIVDHLHRMMRIWDDTEPLLASSHSRVVDSLDVDTMLV